MNKLKNHFLKLIPIIILSYNAWVFYDYYEQHNTKINGITDSISGMDGKLKINAIKLKKINKFKANLEKSKEKINEINEQIKLVQKQLPSNLNDTDVITQIQEEGEILNLRDTSLLPAQEDVKGFYISKDYKFEGIGTYLQFIIFFERLKISERLFNVKKLLFKIEGVQQKGRFTLVKCETTLESFKYNASYEQRSGIEDIEKQYKY